MDCGSTILKYLVFIFNLLFFMCGCTIVGFGVYMYLGMNNYHEFFGKGYLGAPVVLIVVGVLIALITFFGCCGAISENSCMLMTFGVAMTLIIIAEIGVTIAILVFKSDALKVITKEMNATKDKYGKDDSITLAWDTIQSNFTCCGVNGYKDWGPIVGEYSVPDSCCLPKVAEKGCGKDVTKNEDIDKYIYQLGCLGDFVTTIKNSATAAGVVGAVLGAFQLIMAIASFCLGNKMRARENFA